MADRDQKGRFRKSHSKIGKCGVPKGTRNSVTTEFKKGMTSWNTGTAKTIICKTCGERYKKYQGGLIYCSKKCWLDDDEWKNNISRTKLINPIKYWLGKKRPEVSGENNWKWKGGITSENKKLRSSPEWKRWREKVFERDDYTCKSCGARSGKDFDGTIYLEPHHTIRVSDLIKNKYYQYIYDIRNGITLCRPCHLKTL